MDKKENVVFNMDMIKNKNSQIVSMEEALRDIEPIKWSDKVLSGEKKVLISAGKRG